MKEYFNDRYERHNVAKLSEKYDLTTARIIDIIVSGAKWGMHQVYCIKVNSVKNFINENFYIYEINKLGLSNRSFNALINAEIYSINDLNNITYRELKMFRNLGKKGRKEIIEKLKDHVSPQFSRLIQTSYEEEKEK